MVVEKSFAGWEEFETEVENIFQRVEEIRAKKKPLSVSEPLFRGLANQSWGLKTTLERYTERECTFEDYFRIIRGVRPAAQSFTGKSWDLPEEFEVDDGGYLPPQGYEFMTYLRHHGFPSPLLDWTRSPYVAAFFAFRSKPACTTENVAIYQFIEYIGHAKTFTDGPAVFSLGPYITTDRRHHVQQCRYTFARKKVDGVFQYCNHESAFEQGRTSIQDSLVKYLIPTKERTKVLEKLHFMNINAYSLFGDEEGLMEELAYQEIERREKQV